MAILCNARAACGWQVRLCVYAPLFRPTALTRLPLPLLKIGVRCVSKSAALVVHSLSFNVTTMPVSLPIACDSESIQVRALCLPRLSSPVWLGPSYLAPAPPRFLL